MALMRYQNECDHQTGEREHHAFDFSCNHTHLTSIKMRGGREKEHTAPLVNQIIRSRSLQDDHLPDGDLLARLESVKVDP